MLHDVLSWRASEVAELLGTTTAGVNSALQRAQAALESVELERLSMRRPSNVRSPGATSLPSPSDDVDALVSLSRRNPTSHRMSAQPKRSLRRIPTNGHESPNKTRGESRSHTETKTTPPPTLAPARCSGMTAPGTWTCVRNPRLSPTMAFVRPAGARRTSAHGRPEASRAHGMRRGERHPTNGDHDGRPTASRDSGGGRDVPGTADGWAWSSRGAAWPSDRESDLRVQDRARYSGS